MSRIAVLAMLAALVGALVPASAPAASFTHTTIGFVRESVDGTRGSQRLVGHVTVQAPRSWRRSSRNGAPTATFAATTGSCRATVRVSVRAVATSRSAEARARAVTRPNSTAVVADAARSGGWVRVVRLDTPGAQLYGIAIVRVAANRWADVRAFGSFTGCTDAQVGTSAVALQLPRLLRTAAIRAHVARA